MVSKLNVSTELNCALLTKFQHFHYVAIRWRDCQINLTLICFMWRRQNLITASFGNRNTSSACRHERENQLTMTWFTARSFLRQDSLFLYQSVVDVHTTILSSIMAPERRVRGVATTFVDVFFYLPRIFGIFTFKVLVKSIKKNSRVYAIPKLFPFSQDNISLNGLWEKLLCTFFIVDKKTEWELQNIILI